MSISDPRGIPSIEHLRQRTAVAHLERRYGPDATLQALREATAALRARLRSGARQAVDRPPGDAPATVETIAAVADIRVPAGPASIHEMTDLAATAAAIEQDAEARLREAFAPSLRPVINATGVIIHTNLGRAPLAASVARALASAPTGYVNLEYDLERGERGARDTHARSLLCRLTGAESALVVNNNAAATLVVLAALAAGREVVISRGELVEIGGGFRIPDVMAQSGAILREVGTTNKTRVSDYAAAISERTALILRVHPSNFRIEGFTARPALSELAALAHQFALPLVEDLGSGRLIDAGRSGHRILADEPRVQESLAAGADLVCFSGDKLLGGPQAGIVVGRQTLVDTVRTHPLLRALRVDKLTYIALESTLIEYLAGRAEETLPVLRMMLLDASAIETRARAIAAQLADSGWCTEILAGSSTLGGGSAPGVTFPTRLLALSKRDESAARLAARLRAASPPVIARIEEDRVVLDLRTVLPEEDAQLAQALHGIG